MSQYISPNKKQQLPFNNSYTNYSPVATTTQRKPHHQSDASQMTQAQNFQGSASKNEVENLLNEKNEYKHSYLSALQDLERANYEINKLQVQIRQQQQQSVSPSKASPYRRELERSSPLRQQSHDRSVREEALELELQRLRKQLIEKNVQVEEWMKRATRSEVLAKGGNVNIPEEINDKMQEIERLNRELTQLQLKSQDVGRLEREINDLKSLNKFKDEENERLRQEKTALQLEVYKAQQGAMNSKEAEERLAFQIRHLEQQMNENKSQQETYNRIRDQMHNEEVKDLRNSAFLEKQVLQKELQSVDHQLRSRSRELIDVSAKKRSLEGELAVNQAQLRRTEVTADVWRERAGSAEKEIVYVQERGQQEKEALRIQMKKEQSIERMVLQDKIKTLQTIVGRKEDELQNTQMSLAETNQKKREVELAKLRLQSAVDDLEARNQTEQQIHQRELEASRAVYSNEINTLKKSHDFEKQNLNRNIDSLRYVADKTMQEREEEAARAAQYRAQYLTTAENARAAETSSKFWQQHSQNVERQKSIELQNSEELRRSQVNTLIRSHSRELEDKERQKSALLNTVVQKDYEVRNLAVKNSLAQNELVRKDIDLRNSRIEKSYYQNRALDEQNARLLDNSINYQLRAQDNLRNSQELNAYKNVYEREIGSLNNLVSSKQHETEIWKNSFHRANSRY